MASRLSNRQTNIHWSVNSDHVRVKPGERVRSGWQRSEVQDSNEREGNPRQPEERERGNP